MNAFTFLTENGKFDNSSIMKHAHVLKAYRHISLGEALKKAWFLAKKQQKEYKEVEEDKKSFKPVFNANNGNVLKAFFEGGHADYINRDSSWR